MKAMNDLEFWITVIVLLILPRGKELWSWQFYLSTIKNMTENNEQNNVFHIGPQFVCEKVKHINNINNLSVTCCEFPSEKVDF